MAAEVAFAAVSGVSSKVAEFLFSPILRNISYVFKHQSYMEKLKSQVVHLKSKRQRLEQTVKEAERQGEEIYDEVQQWLINMNEFVERVEKFTDEGEVQAKNKRCFKGLCPNFMTLHHVSKEAVTMAQVATNLSAKGDFNNVSYRPAPDRTEFKNVVRGYQQFDSRMKIFQDVMGALKDSKVSIIGVYGMGGVGKTMLVKEVARNVREEKLFDELVMAEVTQTPDLKTIQDKIGYDLGLTFLQHESLFERSGRLRQRLMKEKRFLVILDNIWAKLDLEAVGIPFGDDDQRQCTLLLTSRNQHVLCNVMNSQKNFCIEVLCNAEAMSLFKNIMGDRSTETYDFQALAVKIVGKCGGLPIAITTIATALKNKGTLVWKDALNQLSNSNPRQIRGMDENVHSSIELSYNFLESEEAKSLFLLCGLYKDGSAIMFDSFVRYGMALGLFKHVHSLEAARNRVHALINILKDSCLLLDGDTEAAVKMHDIIHAVAVSIATDKLMFNFNNVDDLTKELENPIQRDLAAISLPYGEIEELPERLECPKLKLFLLFTKCDSSLQISDLFFERMKELRVLHLTGNLIPPLPSSLGYLINLQTLSLECRPLQDVAIVGRLKKLEILSFRDSNLEQFPVEIGQLSRLRLLDLSNCRRLKVIAPNVIARLSRLEELYIGNSFTRWEKAEGGSNASLVELKKLSKLTTLDIHIGDAQIMLPDLVSVELERYKIFVGDLWGSMDRFRKNEISRILKLNGLEKSIYLVNGMKMLLKRTEELYLYKLNGFQNVVHELDSGEGFPQLKHLHVQNDYEILYIVNSMGQIHCNAFPLLESLSLYNLINLEKICEGHVMKDQSFSKLSIIKVEKCHSLKHFFSFSMAKNFLRLQEMQVTDCTSLKMIVGEESEKHIVHENESINFTRLHSLTLRGLPQLISSGFNQEISRTLSAPPSTSKEIVAEADPEDFMTVLFNNKVLYPILEKLELSSLNIKRIWLDECLAMSTCQNLTTLRVENCSRLKFLFSYSMVISLVQLQKLVIQSCDSLEEVINSTGLGRYEKRRIGLPVFPKLDYLVLSFLPRLATFISEENNILHNHTDTGMQSLFDEKVGLPSLEVLSIERVDNLRKIWHHRLALDSFSKLKNLQVADCGKLMNIFPSNMITGRRLEGLEYLFVNRCNSIEEIIEETSYNCNKCFRKEEFAMASRFHVFPRLISLKLWHLPKLKCISQGIHILEWPVLEELQLSKCETVEILFASSELLSRKTERKQPLLLVDDHKVSFPSLMALEVTYCDRLKNLAAISTAGNLEKLTRMKITDCKMIENIIELQAGEEGKEDHIVFDQLKYLELDSLPRLENFCLGNYTLEFPHLEQVAVIGCPSMKIFSQGALHTPKLHKVQLTEGSWEGNLNFTIQKLFEQMVGFCGFKDLILSQLPRVKEIWHSQALPVNFFSDLRSLVVDDCNILSSAIPANLLRFLNKLMILEVRNCDAVEEVFHLEELNADERLGPLLPKLFMLKLKDLPKLIRFCNITENTIELPSLSYLSIENCPTMETFISNSTQVDMKANKKTRGMASEENFLLDGQPLFDKKFAFPNLEVLKLSKLPKLLHLWKENSHPSKAFQNLESLEISECSKLEELLPSSVNFQNLTTIEVSKCDTLRNLLTLSTAESLVKLTGMNVSNCQMIEDIIQEVGEEVKKDRIIFDELEYLKLDRLPSLTRFCTGNYTLEFPSLKQVIVKDCPNMEIFSQGLSSTPKLHRLQLTESENEERWEGSLNSTIQKFVRRNGGTV